MDMNLDFDVKKVFQERLATSMGLDKYKYIIDQVHKTNVAMDEDFQRTFNGFYIVRRNEEWRKIYYNYFEVVKNENPSFESILRYLYEKTGNVETSFSSKMLASISTKKPIWDKYVVQNLGLKLNGTNKVKKLNNAISLYEGIEEWYETFMNTKKCDECIAEFNRVLPDYKDISDIKKIDSILWSIR